MPTRAELLIDVPELAEALTGDDPPAVLDVRWRLAGPPAEDDYAAGHIPGAVFIDLDTELCGRPGAGGRHPLPDPAALQASLRAAGVRDEHPVVVYDGGEGPSAARAWWTLRWAGHRSVRLLRGGFGAWQRSGHPVSSDPPSPAPGDVVVRPGALPVLDAGAAAALATGRGVLLDVRAGERYRGESEPIDPIAGHIPGAVNLPLADQPGADGNYPATEELRERFEAAGVLADRPVGAYCGSGVTAAQTVFALHLAGRPDAALYAGSWSHWITDPDRPVETGR